MDKKYHNLKFDFLGLFRFFYYYTYWNGQFTEVRFR